MQDAATAEQRTGSPFPHLFAPGQIGSLRLKNRILKAPQSTGLGNTDGTVSDRTIRHYRKLARGGAGLVMVEYTYVDDIASKSAHCQLGISSNEHIAGLSWLTATVKEEGAAVGLQIEHCGRQKFLGTPPLKASSAKPWPALFEQTGIVPEVLTIPEIEQIVESFGDAARRAVMAGFDLVEIHGAHGYLITNFLSSHTNDRTDHYGGTLEGRMRFLVEIAENVRAKVPPEFPVTVRLSGTDYEPDGITIEETIEVCHMLASLGIAAIHVSGGDHHTMAYQVSPMAIPRGPNVWAAKAVKEAVALPVIASGSITLPGLAEQILTDGSSDFVALGRPLLADPEWPAKAQAGNLEDIRPCIRCNDGCLDRTFMRFRSVRCTVNPDLGREDEVVLEAAATPRRVAVVGGGPAGLESARILALRGHDVTLYERNRLGGALLDASIASLKSDLLPLLDHLLAQVDKLGVRVVASEADPAELASGGYAAIVIAVGSVRRRLALPAPLPLLPALDVLRGGEDIAADSSVVVIGGGFVGVETALHLSERGCRVTVVEAGPELMVGDVLTDRITFGELLTERRVTVLTETRATETVEGAVVVESSGATKTVAGDVAIAAVGATPQGELADALAAAAPALEVYSIGDCVAPARLYEALHQAHQVARRI